MKKVLTIMGLVIICIAITGCKNSSIGGPTIYTSIYPIEYITERLYGENARITSMYPQGINPYEYKFAKTQIDDFSKADIIIYNGIEDEKDEIVKMISKNRKLKIIDATSKINYEYNMDEIWINPSNALMIANNIKNGLSEYTSSELTIKKINNNYEELKLELSSIDAELKEMAENANDNNIVVSSNKLNFLNKYGFNVISLDESTYTEGYYNAADSLAKDGVIKYIYLIKDEKENDIINRLKSENEGLEIRYIDTLNNISTTDKSNDINYMTIMKDNIDKLKEELYN